MPAKWHSRSELASMEPAELQQGQVVKQVDIVAEA